MNSPLTDNSISPEDHTVVQRYDPKEWKLVRIETVMITDDDVKKAAAAILQCSQRQYAFGRGAPVVSLAIAEEYARAALFVLSSRPSTTNPFLSLVTPTSPQESRMPIIHVSQLVICCLESDTLYRVTVFGKEEVLDSYDTITPLALIVQAKVGRLASSHNPQTLYHLVPLKIINVATPT